MGEPWSSRRAPPHAAPDAATGGLGGRGAPPVGVERPRPEAVRPRRPGQPGQPAAAPCGTMRTAS
eukprot:scaffold57631_cov33-Phaeocystis_antarctica.AAC.1